MRRYTGVGIAVVPTFYVKRELESGVLHMPFGDPIRSDDSYFAVYPERKSHNPNIILFRDWLMRQTKNRDPIKSWHKSSYSDGFSMSAINQGDKRLKR
jgi:hypothetical protein